MTSAKTNGPLISLTELTIEFISRCHLSLTCLRDWWLLVAHHWEMAGNISACNFSSSSAAAYSDLTAEKQTSRNQIKLWIMGVQLMHACCSQTDGLWAEFQYFMTILSFWTKVGIKYLNTLNIRVKILYGALIYAEKSIDIIGWSWELVRSEWSWVSSLTGSITGAVGSEASYKTHGVSVLTEVIKKRLNQAFRGISLLPIRNNITIANQKHHHNSQSEIMSQHLIRSYVSIANEKRHHNG